MTISFLRVPQVLQNEDSPERFQACGDHCAGVVLPGGGRRAA